MKWPQLTTAFGSSRPTRSELRLRRRCSDIGRSQRPEHVGRPSSATRAWASPRNDCAGRGPGQPFGPANLTASFPTRLPDSAVRAGRGHCGRSPARTSWNVRCCRCPRCAHCIPPRQSHRHRRPRRNECPCRRVRSASCGQATGVDQGGRSAIELLTDQALRIPGWSPGGQVMQVVECRFVMGPMTLMVLPFFAQNDGTGG